MKNPRKLAFLKVQIIYRFLASLLLAVTFACCDQPKVAKGVIHGDSINHKFLIAEKLRNDGQFQQADSAYSFLLKQSLSAPEKDYAQINSILARLLNNDTLVTDQIPPSSFVSIRQLVHGIATVRYDKINFEPLHTAKALFTNEEADPFFTCIVNEQLGLAHRQKGSYMDSVSHYYSLSLQVSRQEEHLDGNRARLLKRMAMMSLVHRDELSGIGFIHEAFSLTHDNIEKATLLVLKATLLRKLNRLEESKVIQQEAQSFIDNLELPHLSFLLFREQVFYGLRIKDSTVFKKSMEGLEGLEGKVPALRAHIDRLYGAYHSLNKQTIEKIKKYKSAFNGFRHERLPDTAIVFETLYELTDGYLTMGNLEEAQHYAYLSLVFSTSLANTPYAFDSVIDPEVQLETYNFINYDILGNIYLQKHLRDKKQEHLLKSFELYTLIDSLMLEQIRTHEDEATLEFARLGHGIYSRAIETCFRLYQISPSLSFLDKAHRFMERSNSLLTYQDMLKHESSYFPNVPREMKVKELELKMNLSSIKRNPLHNQSHELNQALDELETFYKKLEKDFPAYFNARHQLDIPNIEYFANRAETENKSLIQYHQGENAVYAIRYDRPVRFLLIEMKDTLVQTIIEFRKALARPSHSANSLKTFKQLSFEVHSKILKPLGQLKTNVQLVPGGILNSIPFEALLTDTTGNFKSLPYLLMKHNVSYSFSLKLSSKENRIKPIKTLMAYSYTDKNKSKSELPQLPGALKELEHIESIYNDEKTIFRKGTHANGSQFLKEIEGDLDLIHLGLHATSDASDRLENRIYFQSPSGGTDTVFGFEIIPKFIRAHTAILTACESGTGAFVEGEGTVSLARAFHQAGVDHVVSSLWSLPDFSSPILCKQIYTNLKNGSSPTLALSQSKREYLKNADNLTAAPFYWAGLIAHTK